MYSGRKPGEKVQYAPFFKISHVIFRCILLQVTTASPQERLSLELFWGNGTIEYSIDETSEKDIGCRLHEHTLCIVWLDIATMHFYTGRHAV